MKSGIFCWLYMLNFKFLLHNSIIYHIFDKNKNDITMKNLMSHSDYEDAIDLPSVSDAEFRIKSRNHRSFLKQPLELWMFVPCDEDGDVLEEPSPLQKESDFEHHRRYYAEYIEAKERCLFEGFELDYDRIVRNKDIRIKFDNYSIYLNTTSAVIKSIEDLVKYNLQLTPNSN